MVVQWNKVTWYSKLLAVLLGAGIFLLGLSLGKEIGQLNTEQQYLQSQEIVTHQSLKQDQALPNAIEQSSQSILGSWKSLQNIGQEVKYLANNRAEVYYNGELNTTFTWEIQENETGDLVIKELGSPARYYKIQKLDQTNLEIVYLYNNKVLTYKRVGN